MTGWRTPVEVARTEDPNLADWEALVIEACGRVIEFWGFKRNQGRVWALLYLRDATMSAAELQGELGLSKAAVSMLTRELEGWGVLRRVRPVGQATWGYQAETELMKMIGRVLTQREFALVTSVREDLDEACRQAKRARAPAQVQDRIERMRTLAGLVEHAVKLFLQTARLDVSAAVSVLSAVRERRRKRRSK